MAGYNPAANTTSELPKRDRCQEHFEDLRWTSAATCEVGSYCPNCGTCDKPNVCQGCGYCHNCGKYHFQLKPQLWPVTYIYYVPGYQYPPVYPYWQPANPTPTYIVSTAGSVNYTIPAASFAYSGGTSW